MNKKELWKEFDCLCGHIAPSEYTHIVVGLICLKRISSDWNKLGKFSSDSDFGFLVNNAISMFEDEYNLKDVFFSDYSNLDNLFLKSLFKLVDSVENLETYDYIFEKLAGKQQREGYFHTPKSIAKLVLSMIETSKLKIYDPCCGAANFLMQVSSSKLFGREEDFYFRQLAVLNSIVYQKQIDMSHKYGLFDRILTNVVSRKKSKCQWIKEISEYLSPNGEAAFVVDNCTMSNKEKDIRKEMIDSNLVSCIVTLPNYLFVHSHIPACLWIIVNGKRHSEETLFIDACALGVFCEKDTREIYDDEISKIVTT